MENIVDKITPVWIYDYLTEGYSKGKPPKTIYHVIQYIGSYDGVEWFDGRFGGGDDHINTEQELIEELKKLNQLKEVKLWIIVLFATKESMMKFYKNLKAIDKSEYRSLL